MTTSAERIAQGFSSWLEAEIGTSDASRSPNRNLSKYDVAIKGWREEAGLGKNLYLDKKMGHVGRFFPDAAGFMGAFLASPQNEESFSRLFFAGLMRVSGENRELATVSAANQTEYEMYRSLSAKNIGKLVLPEEFFTTDDILASAEDNIINPIREAVDFIVERANSGADFGERDSPLAIRISSLRLGALSFCLDMTAYGIQTFGSLEQVPALEPFSISDDPTIIKPFDLAMWSKYVPSNPKYLL